MELVIVLLSTIIAVSIFVFILHFSQLFGRF